MTQATAFYASQKINGVNFISPYPNAYLYTYRAGTDNLIATYKDQEGTENEQPLKLDENGSAVVFIVKGLAYKYVFKDDKGNVLGTFDNITQLAGADGGEPQPFNPTPEELEPYRGHRGAQGLSVIGEVGDEGPQGRRGADFYTAVQMINNQQIEIPAGISEVFITASGGGGAGANYSNCIFMYDFLSASQQTQQGNSELHLSYKYSNESGAQVYQSKNLQRQQDRDLAALYFLPGSGFAGQSTYRYKFTFDDNTIDHKVQAYIGNGGQHSTITSNLNGGNGTSTKIYIDDKLILELAGGVGGKQQFPYVSTAYTAAPSYTIYENQGMNHGTIYLKLTMGTGADTGYNRSRNFWNQNDNGNTDWFYTSYYKSNGSLWDNTPIYVAAYFREQGVQVSNGGNTTAAFPLKQTDNLKGEQSVFLNYYTSYQSYTNDPQGRDLYNSKKGVNPNTVVGYGCGGDCGYNYYFSPRDQNLNISTYGYTIPLMDMISAQYIYFADKTYLQGLGENLLKNFEPRVGDAVAYSPGIKTGSVPDGYWDSIDRLISNIKSKGLVYQGPGFYKLDYLTLKGANNVNAFGDNGQPGFVLLEYGNITEK